MDPPAVLGLAAGGFIIGMFGVTRPDRGNAD